MKGDSCVVMVYLRRKWTWRPEFKTWTRQFGFYIALIPLGKVQIQPFPLLIWVSSRADWFLYLWYGNRSRKKKTLHSELLKVTSCHILLVRRGCIKHPWDNSHPCDKSNRRDKIKILFDTIFIYFVRMPFSKWMNPSLLTQAMRKRERWQNSLVCCGQEVCFRQRKTILKKMNILFIVHFFYGKYSFNIDTFLRRLVYSRRT